MLCRIISQAGVEPVTTKYIPNVARLFWIWILQGIQEEKWWYPDQTRNNFKPVLNIKGS